MTPQQARKVDEDTERFYRYAEEISKRQLVERLRHGREIAAARRRHPSAGNGGAK